MIRIHRIRAFLLRHWFEMLATMDRKVDIIFWPIIDLLTFGFLTAYIDKLSFQAGVASAILGGLILWVPVYSIQRDITVSLLEEAWSRNLYNIFSSPLCVSEVITGTLLLSLIKALIIIIILLSLSWSIFGFSLLAFGGTAAFFVLNIFIFGWAFGYFTSYLIFRFGTRVQTVAWSLVALLYPISGVFYPLSTLPAVLADIARLFPISYIFEALRNMIISKVAPDTRLMIIAFALNIVYLSIGIYLYVKGFKHAKKRGWFIHPS